MGNYIMITTEYWESALKKLSTLEEGADNSTVRTFKTNPNSLLSKKQFTKENIVAGFSGMLSSNFMQL